MKILITGTAGFIGFHLVHRLQREGVDIFGLDNINDYYDVNLKYDRLADTGIGSRPPTAEGGAGGSDDVSPERISYGQTVASTRYENYRFIRLDLVDRKGIEKLFSDEKFDVVINLAAQAGVRYSLQNPHSYVESNINGYLNLLEACRHNNVAHLIYASSSSVYGTNTEMPFRASDNVDHPVSLYAASKKSNELMAHTYSHLFGLPTTGLRFFTVYGPWGRPDMALFLFTKAMLEGKPIDVFNYGEMERDFTYVSDIVEGIAKVLENPPATVTSVTESTTTTKNSDAATVSSASDSSAFPLVPGATDTPESTGKRDIAAASGSTEVKDSATVNRSAFPSGTTPYRLFNIGNGSPVKLMDFISEIESNLGIEAEKNMMEIQPGDVSKTWADVEDLVEATGYRPRVSVAEGVKEFVKWYKTYYNHV